MIALIVVPRYIVDVKEALENSKWHIFLLRCIVVWFSIFIYWINQVFDICKLQKMYELNVPNPKIQ